MGKNSAKIDLIHKLCSDFYVKSLQDQLKDLGISPSLSDREIKKQLRQLAIKHHTDKGGNSELFKKILLALTTLGNKGPAGPEPVSLSKLDDLINRYSIPPGEEHPGAQHTIPPVQPSIVPKNDVSPTLTHMPIPRDNPRNSIWGDWYQNHIDNRQKT